MSTFNRLVPMTSLLTSEGLRYNAKLTLNQCKSHEHIVSTNMFTFNTLIIHWWRSFVTIQNINWCNHNHWISSHDVIKIQ